MKDKIQGKAEEVIGRLTGDQGLELKGKGRQVAGEAKRVGKEVAHDLEHADDAERADETRTDDLGPPPSEGPRR